MQESEKELIVRVLGLTEQVWLNIFPRYGTLLFHFFFVEKLTNYKPPHKRVPKGEKKGFPVKKLLVAFFAVLGKTPQEIFQLLPEMGIRYGVVKNWFTEPEFKKLVLKWRTEIKNRVVDKITELSKSTDIALTFWDNDPSDLWKIFGHGEDYGEPLLNQILLTLTAKLNETKSLTLLMVASKVLLALFHNFKTSDEMARVQQEVDTILRIHILGLVYHRTKTTMDQSLSELLIGMIYDMADRIGMPGEISERIVTDDSWTQDDAKFLGTASLLFPIKDIEGLRSKFRRRKTQDGVRGDT
jgi:hypothetical protein